MKSHKDEGEPVEGYIRKKLANPTFRRLHEAEEKKVRLGFMLNRLRNQAGLTQTELALRVGVTQGYIARLETAEARNYEINTLKKIATALHKVLVIGFAEETKMTPHTLRHQNVREEAISKGDEVGGLDQLRIKRDRFMRHAAKYGVENVDGLDPWLLAP